MPRPHVTSPKPAAPAHSARARCRRPAAQCPRPATAWVTTGRHSSPIRASPRACPRPEGAKRPATAGPCRHHEPSRHCRPGDACVPIRAAGARPVHLHKAQLGTRAISLGRRLRRPGRQGKPHRWFWTRQFYDVRTAARTAVAMAAWPRALGWNGRAKEPGSRPSTSLIVSGWQKSWPIGGRVGVHEGRPGAPWRRRRAWRSAWSSMPRR